MSERPPPPSPLKVFGFPVAISTIVSVGLWLAAPQLPPIAYLSTWMGFFLFFMVWTTVMRNI